MIVSVNTLDGKATFTDVTCYEGVFLTDTFVKEVNERQRFILSNESADTSTLSIEVTRGTVTDAYLKGDDITALNASSKSYFLEESEYRRPELIFGDGVIGGSFQWRCD